MAMTDRSAGDIRALLEDLYLGPSPPYRDEILRASAGIRQRPSWSFPAHWVPALAPTERIAAGPGIPWRAFAVAALLAALLAGLTLVVGTLTRDDQRTVPLEGIFIPAGPMALERLGGDILAVGLSDGRVLIMGGHTEGDESRDVMRAEIFDPATGMFTATGAMQEAHGTLTSATLLADGRVLIAGGWHPTDNGSAEVGAEFYDPASGQFTATGPMVMARYGHTATLLEDGQVLIAGGDVSISGNDVLNPPAELFDPESGTFTAIEPLAVNRLYHTATRLSDGRVLLAGGHLADATAEVFDPTTATSARVEDLGHGRNDHTATLLRDGRVLLVGGNGEDETGKGTLASAELFDPATGTFSDAGSLTSNRSGHGAVGLADGRVLITGGDNHDGSPRSSEIFDPTTGRFALAALAVGTGQRDALLLPDGRVLVVGGSEPTAIAELFDPDATSSATTGPGPSSGRFRPVTDDLGERFGQTATLLADGRVLMVGGSRYAQGDFWGRPLASAVLYDPATGGITETGSLGTPRAFHTATLLADGRVLVAGGDGPGRATDDPNDLYQPLASAELYDPATGRFSETGAMSVRRGPSYMPVSDHERPIALLLADGRVLMAGGVAAESAPDALPIELFDPTSGSFEALGGECSSGLGMTGVGQALGEGRALVACGDTVVVVDPQDGLLTLGDAGGWQDGWGIAVEDKVVLTAGDTGPVVLVDPATGRIARIDEVTGRDPLSDLLGSDALVQAAVRLPSGRLVIIGRSYEEPTHGLAAIHDPATGRTTRLEPLAARTWPTVTVLADGRVLIAGQPIRSPDHFERRPPASELLDPGQVP